MTFSDDDVDLRGIAEDAYRLAESCGHTHVECIEAAVNHVLGALRDAGRLLPEGAETRTEWAVKITWDDGHAEVFPCADRADARDRYDTHVELRRKGDWAVTPTLMRRSAVAYTSPWVPVSSLPTEEAPDSMRRKVDFDVSDDALAEVVRFVPAPEEASE